MNHASAIFDKQLFDINFIVPYSGIYVVPTKATYVVRENQNQAMVCFVAAPVAALRVNVTVVAMEDDVPSARCMAEMKLHVNAMVIHLLTLQLPNTSLPVL